MICSMKYCDKEVLPDSKRCETHTKNIQSVSGNCSCGQPSKYRNGMCSRCYQTAYRLQRKMKDAVRTSSRSSSTKDKNLTAYTPEINGLYLSSPIDRDIWIQKRLAANNKVVHIESEIYRLCTLLRDHEDPKAKEIAMSLYEDMPIALGIK